MSIENIKEKDLIVQFCVSKKFTGFLETQFGNALEVREKKI